MYGAASNKRRDRYHHKKTHRLEFSGHSLQVNNHTRLLLAMFYVSE